MWGRCVILLCYSSTLKSWPGVIPALIYNIFMNVANTIHSWTGPVPSWASYQIRKLAGCACAGNAGNVFPRRRFQRKLLVSDPGMHHGTCVTHVPWCMSGSLTCGDGENVPGIPGACAPAILRIWQEAHVLPYLLSQLIWVYRLGHGSLNSFQSYDTPSSKFTNDANLIQTWKLTVNLHQLNAWLPNWLMNNEMSKW